jgi:SAM-dependent methyltransferase
MLEKWEVERPDSFLVGYKKKIEKILAEKGRSGELNINIGCGDGWSHPNWVGLDYSRGPVYPKREDATGGLDMDWNVLWGLPFEDESVDAIFISHVLEHFTYKESLFVLNECHRVLKRAGRMRIVVPDLDLYLGSYCARREDFFREPFIAGSEWLGNLTDTFLSNFYSAPACNGTWHKYAYNYENLAYRLRQCGFMKVERSQYMKSKWCEFNHADFDSPNPKVPVFSLYVDVEK